MGVLRIILGLPRDEEQKNLKCLDVSKVSLSEKINQIRNRFLLFN